MLDTIKCCGALAVGLSLAVGCSRTDPSPETSPAHIRTSPAPESAFLLTEKPAGAKGVAEARESTEDEQPITVTGRIGGSEEPFVEGLAAFTIVDPSVPHCSADEGCPTPWDYCCQQDQMRENKAMVKLVDAEGNPVARDARTVLGVEGLSTVIVQGKAKRDDAGNLTVLAEKVHVVKD